jgi:putative membrane protein
MMWWGHGDWGWGGWLVMSLTMIVFWGLIIWAVITVVRALGTGTPRRYEAPEDILADRFARGEIDEAEYWRRRDALRGTRPRDSDSGGDP